MTGQELIKLWELYPEARILYEQYNEIRADDEQAWQELTATAEAHIQDSRTELQTTVILETIRQLELLARAK